jgi:hypothetical protein
MSSNFSKWKSIGFRAAAAIIATVLFHTGLPLVWAGDSSASAEFGAGQPARYNENVNGDFLLIGNTVLKCLSSNTLCTNNGEVNDDLLMNNNDPDGAGPLFNGSSGSLTTPSGAVVDAAYLYWGGNLGAKSASSNSYYCNPTKNPASMATADRTAANSVQLAVAGGAYATVSADTPATMPPINTHTQYECVSTFITPSIFGSHVHLMIDSDGFTGRNGTHILGRNGAHSPQDQEQPNLHRMLRG